jgi:hypothetical protein
VTRRRALTWLLLANELGGLVRVILLWPVIAPLFNR